MATGIAKRQAAADGWWRGIRRRRLRRADGRDRGLFRGGAVLSAGFDGFALGATPTAIANMTAVTKKHGPAPNAFLILPLVAAFFVDIANAVVIGWFVG